MTDAFIVQLLRDDGSVATELPIAAGAPLVIGRSEFGSIGVIEKRCSREQITLACSSSAACDLTVKGGNTSYVVAPGATMSDAKEVTKGSSSVVLAVGSTVYLLKDKESHALKLPVKLTVKVPPAAAAASSAAPAPAPSPSKKRSLPGAPAAAAASTSNGKAPIVIEIDDDDDEEPPSKRVPPNPPAAAAAAAASRPAGSDDEEEETERAALRARRRAQGPGNWLVRRGGRFVPYDSGVQEELEAAYMSGLPSKRISVTVDTGEGQQPQCYLIDFAKEPMVQADVRDQSKWRPVRRDTGAGTEAAAAAAAPMPTASAANAQYKSLSAAPLQQKVAPPAKEPMVDAAAAAPPAQATNPLGDQLDEIRKQRAAKFAAAAAAAEPSAGSSSATATANGLPPGPLHLLTYNVWFEKWSRSERMAAIGELADAAGSAARPSVIALQELTPELHGLLNPQLRRAGYQDLVHQPWRECPSNGEAKYGVALATRPPLSPLQHGRYQAFTQSMMSRGLVLGTTTWYDGTRLVLGSTHLESFVGQEMNGQVSSNRASQLKEAAAILSKEAEARGCAGAILLGDMNWEDAKDGDPLRLLGSTWQDAFISAGRPKGTAATCYWQRFDRCFVHTRAAGSGGSLRVAGVQLVGKQPLPGLFYQTKSGKQMPLCPSDHKGLVVSFEAGVLKEVD